MNIVEDTPQDSLRQLKGKSGHIVCVINYGHKQLLLTTLTSPFDCMSFVCVHVCVYVCVCVRVCVCT